MAGIVALVLGYTLSQFYRSFLAVLTPSLAADIGMTKADLSLASGAWFLVFALMQFPVGIALDRYGPRVTAALLLGLCGGLGCAIFAVASAPWMIVAAMALIGAGCAPVLMASLFIFARSYPPARFAVLTSWFIAIGSAGNIIGASPLAGAASTFGWRPVMGGLAVVTALVAMAIVAIVRDPANPRGETQPPSTGLRGYLELMKMPVLWAIIPLTAINYAPSAGIRGLWAGPYLADVYGASTIAIGEVTLFMAIAMVAGSFVLGPLDTLFNTRKWVNVAANALSLLALIALATMTTAGLPAATALLVMVGLTGLSYGMMMAHARAFLPPHLTGRGVTLMNFFSIGGVGVMQFATGAVVTANADPAMPAAQYSALFGFYALLLALSLAIYLFARDAPPKPA